jgi:hypothetical protein
MPNVFPEVQPDRCKRSRKTFDNRVQAADGGLQVNVPHPLEQFKFVMDWTTGADTDADLVIGHFDVNRSTFFTFFDFNVRAIPATGSPDVVFGTGDGATVTFTLPAKLTSGVVIKKNGTTQTLTTNYTLQIGLGPDGEDQVTFVVAPAGGAVLAYRAALGRRRHITWYTTVEIEETPVEANIWSFSVAIEEKLP